MKVVMAALLLAFHLPVLAQEAGIKEGMPFARARSALLAHHWEPFVTNIEGEHIGVENQLLKKKIVEVESCAIDRPLCIFNYKRADGSCLRVMARGEKVKDLLIDSWSSDCPN